MDPNSNTLGIFTEHVRQIACPKCEALLDVSDFRTFEDILCPACNASITVPARLGNFILLEELGRGAMGCVYLAQDESLGRMVALKVMRREYGDDPKMLETLQREAQAMATLNHRNVVQVYSFGRESGQPYFVMELLQGERLDEMMANGGIVPELRLLEIAIDVAEGLKAAHDAGLTHGDIKPANILMDTKGTAKVVDFGLARFMDPDAEIEVWGTPYYIAPEKARKKGEDSRSDQYSLGATMFHALAGHPPFDGENPTKVVVAALKEETPDLREHNPSVTEETAAVIRRMMDKTPTRRFPTYASLMSDLRQALASAQAAEQIRREAEMAAQEKPKKKNTLLPVLVGSVLMICLGVAAVVWMQRRKANTVASVQYAGPKRELHAPFITSEERNLRDAVDALKKGQARSVQESLLTAGRFIPQEHAAQAWYRFFTAGILLYANQPENAKALLERAAEQAPIVFDGGRVPKEDPRVLARRALGKINDRDLDRRTAGSQVYFVHLAELAKGYGHLLEGRPNDAARHFRSYGEQRVQGLNWPYILQPLSADFHMRHGLGEGLDLGGTEEAPAGVPPETAKTMPATAVDPATHRDDKNRPVLRVARLSPDGRSLAAQVREQKGWEGKKFGDATWLNTNDVVVGTPSLLVREGYRFGLAGIFRLPSREERQAGKTEVIFFIGDSMEAESKDSERLVNGVFLGRLAETTVENSQFLHLRIGNGQRNLYSQNIKTDSIKPGQWQLFALIWDGWNPEGKPANELQVVIDGRQVGKWKPQPSQQMPVPERFVASWGRAPDPSGDFSKHATNVGLLRAFVLDRVPRSVKDLYDHYKDNFAEWNP